MKKLRVGKEYSHPIYENIDQIKRIVKDLDNATFWYSRPKASYIPNTIGEFVRGMNAATSIINKKLSNGKLKIK